MYEIDRKGSLEAICGSMFSGKSEELIRRIRRVQFAKRTVAVFKPQVDNRYSCNDIVTHNGVAMIATTINDSSAILNYVDESTNVVAIDEVQFFDNKIVEVVQQLANRGHRVIVAGLDQDFRGEPFGPMPQILALAEEVTKLRAVCSVCGSAASRTQRLINGEPASYDDPIILVGASESYEARCRQHHVVGQLSSNKISD